VLIYLAPEVMWDTYNLNDKDLKRMPHLMELCEQFMEKASLD
jgi:hypothetical protein